ncbi:MAG: DUF6636 domain-containing protein [Gemmatimonadaceae bacterium]|nr:DUF6636 domain-containing protein [Gemmatimonadaceae bacterium]
MRRVFALLLLLPFGLARRASAQTTEAVLTGFRAPSGNIFCQAFAIGPERVTELRCDLLRNEAPRVRRPADCEQEYGNAFSLQSRGRPTRLCVGDTVADPALPILAYGGRWTEPGVSCELSSARLRCVNGDGHTLELSRRRQRLR